MKARTGRSVLAAALAATLAALGLVANAHAHGAYGRPYYSGARVGVYVGPGWGVGVWGGYPGYVYPYPAPYYYYPYAYPFAYTVPRAVVPAPPPVYVERGESAPEAAAPEGSPYWWYYCWNPAGYYPYVTECPGGWQRVTPQPAPAR
jgi:hypothetical protein